VSDRESSEDHLEKPPFDQDYGSFVADPAEQVEESPTIAAKTVPETPELADMAELAPDRVFAGTGISWAFIFGAILTAAIIILAVQNTDSVPVKLFFWETKAPLIIVMLVTALVVILIDEMIGLIIRRRKRKMLAEREELKRLRAQADTKGLRIE
jgi:uncharacterized integral membrane protein